MTCPDNSHNPHADDRSVLSIIRDIKQGAIEAKNLAIEDRRRCVEYFTGEAYSAAETAEILKVAERTIARDRAANRLANAVECDPQLTGQIVGQLMNQAETCLQHIRRVTRERDVSPSVRVEGERTCWLIFDTLVQRLQSLGYVTTAPQQLRAEMKHQIEAVPDFIELKDEATRIELIVKARGIGEENLPLLQQLTDLKDQVERGSLSEQIAAIENRVVNSGEIGDEKDT